MNKQAIIEAIIKIRFPSAKIENIEDTHVDYVNDRGVACTVINPYLDGAAKWRMFEELRKEYVTLSFIGDSIIDGRSPTKPFMHAYKQAEDDNTALFLAWLKFKGVENER